LCICYNKWKGLSWHERNVFGKGIIIVAKTYHRLFCFKNDVVSWDTSGYLWRSDIIWSCRARPCPVRAQSARAPLLGPVRPCLARPCPCPVRAQSRLCPCPCPVLAQCVPNSCPVPTRAQDWLTDRLSELIYRIGICCNHPPMLWSTINSFANLNS
jgi:hypothetical protein